MSKFVFVSNNGQPNKFSFLETVITKMLKGFSEMWSKYYAYKRAFIFSKFKT